MNAPRIVDRIIKTDQGLTYEIEDEIGWGGNCTIYRCYDVSSGEAFAVKIIGINKANRIKRFEQEIEILSAMDHEHIIRCFGAGKLTGEFAGKNGPIQKKLPFCILELASMNLRQHLEFQNWRIPYEKYISQFRGLASALAELHSQVIHRDIKLENILVIGEKWVLADLGLCAGFVRLKPALTYPDEPLGPLFFMSPEAVDRFVCSKGEIIAASDVFQLASVFWVVINRSHPTGVVERADWTGPEHLFEPLFKCLAHNKDHRPSNGAALHAALELAVDKVVA
jgi:eukaryotic-like serine/threonine-protein kinase